MSCMCVNLVGWKPRMVGDEERMNNLYTTKACLLRLRNAFGAPLGRVEKERVDCSLLFQNVFKMKLGFELHSLFYLHGSPANVQYQVERRHLVRCCPVNFMAKWEFEQPSPEFQLQSIMIRPWCVTAKYMGRAANGIFCSQKTVSNFLTGFPWLSFKHIHAHYGQFPVVDPYQMCCFSMQQLSERDCSLAIQHWPISSGSNNLWTLQTFDLQFAWA